MTEVWGHFSFKQNLHLFWEIPLASKWNTHTFSFLFLNGYTLFYVQHGGNNFGLYKLLNSTCLRLRGATLVSGWCFNWFSSHLFSERLYSVEFSSVSHIVKGKADPMVFAYRILLYVQTKAANEAENTALSYHPVNFRANMRATNILESVIELCFP